MSSPSRKLSDSDPCWIVARQDPTRIVGVSFLCPLHDDCYHGAPFSNPLGGGEAEPLKPGGPLWHRVGETFETLTLTPSILAAKEKGYCGWHGYITNGMVTTC